MEAQSLIRAHSSTVWEVITDAGNFPVWDSGITGISGEVRHGRSVIVRTRAKPRTRLRIEQLPGTAMTWTSGIPPLFSFVRTFILAPEAGTTLLIVRDELRGPLRGFAAAPWSMTERRMQDFLRAAQRRAEILDRPYRRPYRAA